VDEGGATMRWGSGESPHFLRSAKGVSSSQLRAYAVAVAV